jgi:hypothetical protein
MQVVGPPYQGCRIDWANCQTWIQWTSLVLATFKPTSIYWWVEEVIIHERIIFRNKRILERFWELQNLLNFISSISS